MTTNEFSELNCNLVETSAPEPQWSKCDWKDTVYWYSMIHSGMVGECRGICRQNDMPEMPWKHYDAVFYQFSKKNNKFRYNFPVKTPLNESSKNDVSSR